MIRIQHELPPFTQMFDVVIHPIPCNAHLMFIPIKDLKGGPLRGTLVDIINCLILKKLFRGLPPLSRKGILRDKAHIRMPALNVVDITIQGFKLLYKKIGRSVFRLLVVGIALAIVMTIVIAMTITMTITIVISIVAVVVAIAIPS